MNVLSLFDGMSCGQQALERAGIKVDNYYASEIDKYAIQVTMANYPNTIQLGSVVDVNGYNLPKIDLLIGGSPCQSFSFAGKRKGMSTKDEQEILTLEHYLQLKSEGYEFEGQSYLFWEYMRLLYEVKPKYFLLENVMMGEKWEKVLSKAIGVTPIMINSSLVSAQNRKRLYWTNIGMESAGLFDYPVSIINQPKDKDILLKDILESDVDEKYFLSDLAIERIERHNNDSLNNNKSNCILAGYHKGGGRDQQYIVHNTMPRSSTTGKGGTGPLSRTDGKTYCLDTGSTNAIEIKCARITGRDPDNPKSRKPCSNTKQFIEKRFDEKTGTLTTIQKDNVLTFNSQIRRLTPVECERLQTVNDNYTNYVSDSQRYRMLGNGWTVDVIAHIFGYLK